VHVICSEANTLLGVLSVVHIVTTDRSWCTNIDYRTPYWHTSRALGSLLVPTRLILMQVCHQHLCSR
jgi:hypothetical protein